jgi:hypothetical protein
MTSSGYVEIPVSLKSILNGQENDREMQAEDILYIPNNAGKSILYRGGTGSRGCCHFCGHLQGVLIS